ncbi:recombinase family protein [Microbacterium oleivorans]|uniref:recombinase family protein n=1 Tax=Microbacterium oleivorans TaxID=273677 RepID=UPI0034061D55
MARTSTRHSRRDLAPLGPESCVLYLRISQDRTGEHLGVERQEKECRALAERLGLHIERVFIDNDVSATSGKARPEFEDMLRSRPEAIVAWHQDRLLRLTSDLEKVIDLEVPIYMVTAGDLDLSSPAGRAVARTVAAWSQYEGEQKSLRQQAAFLQKAERGRWHFSRRPYGYERRDGRVMIVEPEAAIVREGYARYVAGESYYAIAEDWNARGVPTHNTNATEGASTQWSMTRVRAMLRNEHYAGIVTYRGEVIEAEPEWPPLIERRTWDDYTSIRDGRTKPSSWSRSTKHLLSGLLVCAVCGSRLLARPEYRKGADGQRRTAMTYQCVDGWHVSIQARDVEPIVEAIVLARLQDKRILKALRATPDTEPLVAEIADLRRRRESIIDFIADGSIARREARQQLDALGARIDALSNRLQALRRESPLTDLALSRALPKRWRSLGLLERRRVIDELGLRVTVKRGRPGRRPLGADGQPTFDLTRLSVAWLDAEDAGASAR